MKTGIDLGVEPQNVNPDHLKTQLDFETNQKKLANEFWSGIVDKIFSASFFVFIITVLVVASGFVFMNKNQTVNDILEYWKLIVPVVTTYMGYAIGKSSK